MKKFATAVVRSCRVIVLLCVTPFPAFAAPLDPFESFMDQAAPPARLPQLGEGFTDPLRMQLADATQAFEAGDFARSETLSHAVTQALPDEPEGWHMLGMALANQDKLEPAISALIRAGDLYELNAEPYRLAGDMRVSLGDMQAARELYEKALAKDPGNWRAAESFGMVLEQSGELDAAHTRYLQALNAAPEAAVSPGLRLAVVDIELGNTKAGIDRLVDLLNDRPDLEDLRYAVVRELAISGRINDAADVLAIAADKRPDDSVTVLLAAQAELSALRVDKAKTRLNAAYERFGDDPETMLKVGTLLGAARDYGGARSAYEAGLSLAPDDPGLLRGLRTAHYRSGDMENARVAAMNVASLEVANTEDDLWLGFIEEALNAPDRAIAAYRSALDRDSTNWIAANNLASLRIAADPGEAVQLAERAVKQSEGAAQARGTLGLALMAAGRSDEAVPIFAELADGTEASPRTIYRYGMALVNSGDTQAGEAEIARAMDLDPSVGDAEDGNGSLSRN